MTDDEMIIEAGQKILNIIGGMPLEAGYNAMASSFATLIAGEYYNANLDVADAIEMVHRVTDAMQKLVLINWGMVDQVVNN